MTDRRPLLRSPAPRGGRTSFTMRRRVAALLVVGVAGLAIGIVPASASAARGTTTTPSLRAAVGGGIDDLRGEPAAPVVEGRAETIRGAARSTGPTTSSALPTEQPSIHPTARTLARERRHDRATPPAPTPEPELCRPPPSSV